MAVKLAHFLTLRGVPTGIWFRLSDRGVTAIPAGVALALFGMGGLIAALAAPTYPATLRLLCATTASGMILAAISLLRDPRRLVMRRYRAAAALVGLGTIAGAMNLPSSEEWPHEIPVMDTALLDLTIQAGLMMIGSGCGFLVVSSFVRNRRPLIRFAGELIIVGIAIFACSQIVWGVWAARADFTVMLGSVVMGLASLAIVHVLPRTRYLNVM